MPSVPMGAEAMALSHRQRGKAERDVPEGLQGPECRAAAALVPNCPQEQPRARVQQGEGVSAQPGVCWGRPAGGGGAFLPLLLCAGGAVQGCAPTTAVPGRGSRSTHCRCTAPCGAARRLPARWPWRPSQPQPLSCTSTSATTSRRSWAWRGATDCTRSPIPALLCGLLSSHCTFPY